MLVINERIPAIGMRKLFSVSFLCLCSIYSHSDALSDSAHTDLVSQSHQSTIPKQRTTPKKQSTSLKQSVSPKSFENIIILPPPEEVLTEKTEFTEELLSTSAAFNDPVQAIYSLPGMIQLGHSPEPPAVRGSAPEDNVFLIDGMPIGYLFHFYGNSVLDEQSIRHLDILPGGFNAEFGQATGGVFDIQLRAPLNQPIETTFDLSLLGTKLFFEGGITEDHSFFFNYRESLLQYALEQEREEIENDEDIIIDEFPVGKDYLAKYVWQPKNEDYKLSVLLSGASDSTSADIGDGNQIAVLNPGRTGTSHSTLSYHQQSIKLDHHDHSLLIGHLQNIEDINYGNEEFIYVDNNEYLIKAHQLFFGTSHTTSIGMDLSYNHFQYDYNYRYEQCDEFTPNCDAASLPLTDGSESIQLNLWEFYVQNAFDINERAQFHSGFRTSYFEYSDEVYIDPRFSFEWSYLSGLDMSVALGQYHQYQDVERLLPVVGNPDLTPIEATHFVIGFDYPINHWQVSLDVYYKKLEELSLAIGDITLPDDGSVPDSISLPDDFPLLPLPDGIPPLTNEIPIPDDTSRSELEDLIDYINALTPPYINGASGEAYGMEIFIRYPVVHRWSGWVSLSLSESKRENDFTGEEINFSYDLPVVLNWMMNYAPSPKWHVGFKWAFRSGALYTPIEGNRENPDHPGEYLPVYGEINSERAPAYHRLDFFGEYRFTSRRYHGAVYFDIINAYNRFNFTGYAYRGEPNSSEFSVVERGGFHLGVLPSVGFRVSF